MKFRWVLGLLLFMILTLMALGAGVRTMNAGLSCPDWPLCFGKVIPDFHPAVWFEFVHRAYAGLVAIVFFGCFVFVMRSKMLASGVKIAAGLGLVFLIAQIIAGALTVLWLVKWAAVTTHLLLATLFFSCVLWIYFSVSPKPQLASRRAPSALKWFSGFMVVAVFVQIAIGGVVASTYAGSVCVDWPLCNGQWVPAWTGAIGHQIIHRFVAYFLAVALLLFTVVMQLKKSEAWMTTQLLSLSRMNAIIVFLQVGIGVANLLFYIPPALAVLHQTVGVLLLAVNLRIYFVARECARSVRTPKQSTVSGVEPLPA
jgi:heme a synthase